VSVKDLSPRPKKELFTDEEWQKTPITVHGKVQRYQVNVESRLDEDEDAIGLLDEQLLKPEGIKENHPAAPETKKSRWQFWK
jgi:hypothetical protein